MSQFPEALKRYHQWVVYGPDIDDPSKKPRVPYIPNMQGFSKANPMDAATWGTFEQACKVVQANNFYHGIGFVLSEFDPFVFIDLDHKESEEAKKLQLDIYQNVQTYAEKSPSGTGCHLIGYSKSLRQGVRNSKYGVEVYHHSRYMTMTGQVLEGRSEIVDVTARVASLCEFLRPPALPEPDLPAMGEDSPDDVILAHLERSANGAKFCKLYYQGDWRGEFPSQSEADSSLASMMVLFTQNPAQIERIMRASQMVRPKWDAHKTYLWDTIKRAIRHVSSKLPQFDIGQIPDFTPEQVSEPKRVEVSDEPPPVTAIEAAQAQQKQANGLTTVTLPGLAGDIQNYLMRQSYTHTPVMALAGSIALLAGILGRTFQVDGMALNHYITVLIPSGVGKSTTTAGIRRLMEAVQEGSPPGETMAFLAKTPNALRFLGPENFTGAAAVAQEMNSEGSTKCFLSIVDEFGKHMASVVNAPEGSARAQMIEVMLRYHSDGHATVGKQGYSKKENTLAAIKRPCLSILGPTTVSTFMANVSQALVASGLISRMTILRELEDGPRKNLNREVKPPTELVERLQRVVRFAQNAQTADVVVPVLWTKEARQDAEECEQKLFDDIRVANQMQDSNRATLLTRVVEKAKRLAAILAIAQNPDIFSNNPDQTSQPRISLQMWRWCYELSRNDCDWFDERLKTGEYGLAVDDNEMSQLTLLDRAIHKWLTGTWEQVSNAVNGQEHVRAIWDARATWKVVPHIYFVRALRQACFTKVKHSTPSREIERVLKLQIESGSIELLDYKSTLAISNAIGLGRVMTGKLYKVR